MVLQRRRGGNLGLLLLGTQILNFGLENIPPVTLALLGGQVAIFLNLFPKYFPSSRAVCISPYLVLEHRDWKRLILATVFHADDMHLYFNMVSLISKGTMLERKFGNVYFAYLVAVFTALSSVTYVGLGFVLDTVFSDQSYYLTCAVGFSGVLFAMKVLTTHYSPDGLRYALGFIPVPSKYIYWAELVLIQMVSPNASFIGHLAGILVGLMYIKGPLKALMDSFMAPGPAIDFTQANRSGHREQSFFSFGRRLFRGGPPPPQPSRSQQFDGRGQASRPSQSYHATATPSAPYEDDEMNRPNPDGGYHNYTGGLSEDEQYQRALHESMMQSQRSGAPTPSSSSSSQRLYPDLQDLRNRRADFYQ